jgi:hypothetical protein
MTRAFVRLHALVTFVVLACAFGTDEAVRHERVVHALQGHLDRLRPHWPQGPTPCPGAKAG